MNANQLILSLPFFIGGTLFCFVNIFHLFWYHKKTNAPSNIPLLGFGMLSLGGLIIKLDLQFFILFFFLDVGTSRMLLLIYDMANYILLRASNVFNK